MTSGSVDPTGRSEETSDRPHACGICRSDRLTLAAHLPIYIRGGSVPDTIWLVWP